MINKTKADKRALKKRRRKFGISGRGVFMLKSLKLTQGGKKAKIKK